MSLRDQLLAKGLVSKKNVQKANRDLKKQRKKKQAQREKRKVVAAKEAAKEERFHTAKIEQRQKDRKERDELKEQVVRVQRVRQMVDGNAINHQGRTFFHFKKLGGRLIGRLEISEKIGWMLRCGEAAIAAYRIGDREVYKVIGAKSAKRLMEFAPENIVFFTSDTQGISNADEAFLVRKWETSLRARRLK